jgi:uncharacterized protein (DUF608 family)
MVKMLFPVELPELTWVEFLAEGFASPVAGVIYRAGQSSCGVPLGGVGTGCIDLDTDGTMGRCSVFNSFVPHRVLNVPFLTLRVGSQVWGLTTRSLPEIAGPKQIHYWGHYPVADVEYEIDGPVSVGLRAWSPFLPGDAATSNTPAISFDVHVRNQNGSNVRGSIIFSFPGPSLAESHVTAFQRRALAGRARGVAVESSSGLVSYALGFIGEREPRVGGSLIGDSRAWARLVTELPKLDASEAGASLAVDFELQPEERQVIPLLLAWFCPRWEGSPAHHYWHAYSKRFRSVEEVTDFLACHRAGLLARIIGWQSEIYQAAGLPTWMKDQLVNILHTITEDSFWASESIPPEDWYRPTGIFGLTESPRTTPHVCNPSDWYGGLPIVFFFPDLAASLLRSYVHFQLPNGEVPLGIGEGADLSKPTYHLIHTLNSCVHIHLIDRLWQRDCDPAVLREFYPSVRKALTYMKTLDRDGDGLADLEPDPMPNQFYNGWAWYGTAVHVNGYWLAALAMVQRMAESIGDSATAHDCRTWRQTASRSMEEKLWAGDRYLLYNDPGSGRCSDTVLANQLAGEWCARLHRLSSVFPAGHIQKTLATIKRLCMPLTSAGALNAARPDGTMDQSASPQSDGIFTGEATCLAATMAYASDLEAALEIVGRLFATIVLQDRLEWDMPNILDAAGKAIHGTDFYQNMILWALPLAMQNLSIRDSCSQGQLVDRVVKAADSPTLLGGNIRESA